MYIKNIKISKFRAFQTATKIDFSNHINIITGLNGIGKSTILALLTNSSELKAKDCGVKPYLKQNFRGDFSDVIQYDPKTDDITGLKKDDKPTATIEFSKSVNGDSNILTYRASLSTKNLTKDTYTKYQKSPDTDDTIEFPDLFEKKTKQYKIPRFRFLATHSDGTRGKVSWPTIYLGLSRVYPNGENTESKSKKLENDKYTQQMFSDHITIMNEEYLLSDEISAQIVTGDNSSKIGTGLSTKTYGPLANSSGQDNLSQILLAIQSFCRLKDILGDNYNGGLLAIDEIDATLHPAAQNKLLEYLLKKSIDLNLQIIMTSHSLSLIEHSQKMKNNDIRLIEIDHLPSPNQNDLEIIYDPPITRYKNVLSNKMGSLVHNHPKVKAITEDETARYFIEKIITQFTSANSFKSIRELELLDTNMGWPNIIKLINSDIDYYSTLISILDADVTENKIDTLNPEIIRVTHLNQENGVLFTLPGTKSIEETIYDYTFNNDNSKLWSDPKLREQNITQPLMRKSSEHFINENGIFNFKKWYLANRPFADIVLTYYLDDNKEEFTDWIKKINSAVEKLLKNLSN